PCLSRPGPPGAAGDAAPAHRRRTQPQRAGRPPAHVLSRGVQARPRPGTRPPRPPTRCRAHPFVPHRGQTSPPGRCLAREVPSALGGELPAARHVARRVESRGETLLLSFSRELTPNAQGDDG